MKTRLSKQKPLEKILDSFLHCPSCSTWRTAARNLSRSQAQRHASTLTSTTAINGTKSIPAQYRDIYTALADVRRNASPFVSLSRLQLAQQGLQSASPKTKIAVLGLNVQDTARRLVRLLLADALEQEQSWEKELASIKGDQGVLVIHGHSSSSNLPRSRTSIPTLHVPSSLLERSNVEILISAVNPPQNGDRRRAIPSETLLAPTVNTPTAASGRSTLISQPVHASLVVAKGLDEFLSVAELLSAVDFSSNDERHSVTIGFDLSDSNIKPSGPTLILDLTKAERGLSAIRTSINDTPSYARDWNDSGMLQITQWLASTSSNSSTTNIPEPLRRLISSILSAASINIEFQAQSQLTAQSSSILSLATRTNLAIAIDGFSRNAHQELQSGLASAWSSRNWRKLAWYKLFWRVDDVGLIITDLISNAWLPRTERAVYELSGRLAQVGISPMTAIPEGIGSEAGVIAEETTTTTTSQPITTIQPLAQLATTAPTPVEAVITNPAGTAKLTLSPTPTPQPLSTTISTTRANTIAYAIADLTSTAQQLVLRTLSIAGLSAGLSGLTYASLANSIYEAGTIVAVGTVFALWRMQGGWMRKTKELEEGLFDEGRVVIGKVVGRMRTLVEAKGESVGDDVEVRRLAEARASVERAREDLARLVEGRAEMGQQERRAEGVEGRST